MPKTRAKRRRPAAPPAAPAASLRYIESSALVAALLDGEPTAIAALGVAGRVVTSALTLAEAARAIVRARVSGRATDEAERAAVRALRTFEGRVGRVAVSAEILARAGRPFPVEPVRTLDAVHLATLESLGEPPQLVTIVTRDARVRDNARALGYVVE